MATYINTVVVTGGPRCGKQEIMTYVSGKLQELGYAVLVVPELAREMIIAGATPGITLEYYNFEKHLLQGQMGRELSYRKAANDLFAEHVVIIFERGILDAKAFFGEKEWKQLLDDLCIQEPSLLERYDAVIHLRSLAHGKESEFVPEAIDIARTPLEAKIECDKVLRAWDKHRRHHVIDNSTTFEKKMERAFDAVLQSLPYRA